MLRCAKGPEPKALTAWQATPNATWESLPAKDKDEVRDTLLRDQGHLCAYCQRRIPMKDGRMKVEHWYAQSNDKKSALLWSNLLGVCLGDEAQETGARKGEQHCDTARGNAKLFLHPIEGRGPSPREHLRYTSAGKVVPGQEQAEALRRSAQSDIDALNLNAARLKRARREVYEVLKTRLEKAGFTKSALGAELAAATIRPGQKASPQCEVVRCHVLRWARKQDIQLEP